MALRINPESVKAAANRVRAERGEVRAILGRVEAAVSDTTSDWRGHSKNYFMEEYRSWRNQVRQYENLLESIARQLDHAAAEFAKADRYSGGGYGGGGGDSW